MLIAILIGISLYYLDLQKDAEKVSVSDQEVAIPSFVPEIPSTPPIQATTAPETKTYHNEEWGFEFEYPDGWTFHENTFYSPASKFNLVGASPEEKGIPNPIIPPLLVNIITSSFADNVIVNVKKLGGTEASIIVGGATGIKYEYKVGVQEEILVDLPFGKYRLEMSAIKGYEDVFNQILASFKFLKNDHD